MTKNRLPIAGWRLATGDWRLFGRLATFCLCLGMGLAAAQQSGITGFTAATSSSQRQIEKTLLEFPSPERCRQYHARLTREPHVAGTPGGKQVADFIYAEFQRAGIPTELVQYDVLLSYPRKVELEMRVPETVRLANPEMAYDAAGDTAHAAIDPPWNAYSASGELTGQIVYANYGNAEDYDQLAKLGIDVRGRIVLARHFQGYRGGKSLEAERRGVAALIFYSDPADDGYIQGDVYPAGPWGPESHVQRGANVYDFKVPGDPLTPGWASTSQARRLALDETEVLPRIPTVPISYADAAHLLKNLAGPAVPRPWQGGLPFTYHVGPGPAEVYLNLEITRERRPIYNIIGTITGSQEPEKTVVLSNHHDAWVFGAVDPSSGTATMIELAHTLGKLLSQGWRPRRTIVLGCWDAEEYTLTGSTEWGEQHAERLRSGGVACLNVDASVSGHTFAATAVPSLRRFIIEATRACRDPNSSQTIFEKWTGAREGNIRGYSVSVPGDQPVDIGILGSGSDYTVFFNFLGMPSVDMLFDGPYGVYHSRYDNHFWMSRIGDPGFRYHAAMASVWGLMATRLADADILPFEYQESGRDLKKYAADIQKLAPAELPWSTLVDAIDRFAAAAARAQKKIDGLLAGSVGRGEAQRINALLLKVERDFTSPEGLPGRPWFKHLVYAPLPSYKAETFPGVREALVEKDPTRARRQLELLVAAIQRARETLELI
ncbi:MAG: M28 family metallopeptidase [Acidobacteriota bacterium]